MQNINFTGKLIVSENLNTSLKKSPVDDIIDKTRAIVESAAISKLTDDDIVLTALKPCHGEGLLIEFGETKIPIQSRRPISPAHVINQILLSVCIKNNATPLSASPKRVLETIYKLLKEKA